MMAFNLSSLVLLILKHRSRDSSTNLEQRMSSQLNLEGRFKLDQSRINCTSWVRFSRKCLFLYRLNTLWECVPNLLHFHCEGMASGTTYKEVTPLDSQVLPALHLVRTKIWSDFEEAGYAMPLFNPSMKFISPLLLLQKGLTLLLIW